MGGDKLRNEPRKSFVFSGTLLSLMAKGLAGDLRDAMIAGVALTHHAARATRNAARTVRMFRFPS
jgi:predicted nucleic acid-binding protein